MSAMRSEINITPLIDIVLVLLIVFITLVPALDHAWEVRLPKAGPGTLDHAPLRVDLDAAGGLTLDGETLTVEQLQPRVIKAWTGVRQDQRKALIRVHPDHPFKRAAELLDAVKGADPTSSVALDKRDA
jgi:biopolymer transport protein ExbD